jgi:DNA-binding XRE family transcriptional regulator
VRGFLLPKACKKYPIPTLLKGCCNVCMGSDLVVLTNLTEGQKVRITRLSKGLRQVDLASLAKVNLGDITAIEKDRFLRKSRKARILQALGLSDDQAGADYAQS